MININFIIVKILLDISTSNPTEKFKDKRFIWSFDNCYMLLSNFLISIFNQIYKSRRYMVEEYGRIHECACYEAMRWRNRLLCTLKYESDASSMAKWT